MNIKILSLSLLTFCIYIYCFSCRKKLDCPGYKDAVLDKLFMYTNGQLLFKAGTNETQVFTLRNTETTQPYQTSTDGAFIQLFCEANKVFESDEQEPNGQRSFRLVLRGSGSQHLADMQLKQSSFSFYAYADTGFASVNINSAMTTLKYLPVLQIGNRSFTDVTVAVRDTIGTKAPGIYQLYYTRREALVGYADYPSLKTWVKQ
ncbi:MAG TPA: hypothetical protein VM871_04160 [Flavisolibacter sp.]|nr:hypothetical protein [Flavisolibacter sp.]